MKFAIIMVCCVLLQFTWALKFVAYGDSRSSQERHQITLNNMAPFDPDLVLHTGDLHSGYEDKFVGMMSVNPNLRDLLFSNKYLVSRGNHEELEAFLASEPPLIRGDTTKFSFVMENAFFMSLGYRPWPDLDWAEEQLQSEQAQSATWKFIFFHVPLFSSGGHPEDKSTTEAGRRLLAMCDTYGVSMVFNGHSHNYESTSLLYNLDVVHSKDVVTANEKGTMYFVLGGGGAPLASLEHNSWFTRRFVKENHHAQLTITDFKLEMEVLNAEMELIDIITWYRPNDKAPQVSITPIEASSLSPALTGSINFPLATVKVTVDNQEYPAKNNGDGTWTLAEGTLQGLQNGTYDVKVLATDSLGNMGSDNTVDELVLNLTAIGDYHRTKGALDYNLEENNLLVVRIPHNTSHKLEVFNLQGKSVNTFTGESAAEYRVNLFSRGIHYLVLTLNGQRYMQKIVNN